MKGKKIIIGLLVFGALAIIGGLIYIRNAGEATSSIDKESVEIDSSDIETVETSDPTVVLADIEAIEGELVTINERSELFFRFGGLTGTTGSFKKFSAIFNNNAGAKSIEVEIDPGSAFTNSSLRDSHIKEADFFNIKEFPVISYKSQEISLGDTCYVANGTLNFMGQESQQEVKFSYKGKIKGEEKHVFEGRFPFKQNIMLSSQAPTELDIIFYLEME